MTAELTIKRIVVHGTGAGYTITVADGKAFVSGGTYVDAHRPVELPVEFMDWLIRDLQAIRDAAAKEATA